MRERLRVLVLGLVDTAAKHPIAVLLGAWLAIAGLFTYATKLELHSDLLELLPRDSPGFRAFEHQLGRVGGGSTLIVLAESPDRSKNEAFIDDLAKALEQLRTSDEPAGKLIAYVEAGTKDVRAFYEANKWLYADLGELQKIEGDLDHQIALRSGAVVDLEARDTGSGPAKENEALGLADGLERWEARAAERDAFPTGYFETKDGGIAGLRIISSTNLGEARGDALLGAVERVVAAQKPHAYHPGMRIGFTGDIASASDEKKAIMSEAAWATGLAFIIIASAIVAYYGSAWALPIIALPALFGIAVAYAFAEATFGYINTSGAFLGAIILGNGINYPIVLLSRYYDFRARGMAPEVARREAVWNAFRAELVGACVAAIAYGSLSVTNFRGFRQFGVMGFVGMLAAWASIVVLVPAATALVERIQSKLPPSLRDRAPAVRPDGSRSAVTRWLAVQTTRAPWLFLAAGAIMTLVAAWRIPSYARDPWEYDFGKLGSRSSEVSGAGDWSNKANEVFGGKMNIAGALMLADSPEQVPLLAERILQNDANDPQGRLIAEITTIDDYLPGSRREQDEKLRTLESIREHLTPRVLAELEPKERETALRARPPESLRVLEKEDLPPLLRRRFTENDGRLGTVFYVKPRNDVVFADGHNHLRLSKTTDNVRLSDGTVVMTASRSTIFAEILRSMREDGPRVSLLAFALVVLVLVVAGRRTKWIVSVLVALVLGVVWLVGFAAYRDIRVNYVNFIALPITLGIGCEYPFNIADRTRLLDGDVVGAMLRSSGAVLLCSFTTVVGYGSLMFSDVQALNSFGVLAVAGEMACVFSAVVFLPSLLSILGKRRPALSVCSDG
ncbi:MMPL family transporter [Pendulispora brunnea]|uniref:MMPL family transporter n=1 Tax=Pendulispora brunnea TaxID=2905690 RepID=A0ABZ2JYF3_9BACT